MDPIGRFVTVLNKKDTEHVRSASSADAVSCTNKDGPQRNHRAEKRRQDRGSHGRPQSPREFLSARTKSHQAKNPSKQEAKSASTCKAAKKRGGEGAAVTREACWLEREPVVTPHAKYQ